MTFAEQEEEDDLVGQELQYAGVTSTWLRKQISTLAISALLVATKKYKAAIKIQSNYRGWRTRQKIHLWHRSAIKIQKTWRGFLGRIRYYLILESTIRYRMVEHYHKSATKIQSHFRGFHSRKHVHDHNALKNLQLQAAQQLLECVARKTRDLLRNHQLPGTYSLRNSKCLSKVEKLMATLQITSFNEETRLDRTAEVLKLSVAFNQSIRSKDRTELPYGPSCDSQNIKGTSERIYYQLAKSPKVQPAKTFSEELSYLSLNLYKQRNSK